ncbi:hypothetical protein COW36_24700 [bacterium (Candidatus Blackallbacteria) CG17_big_fil_post_rev_8_21_14_2_50_48_46]|uniref:Exostosin GT47 domain-containing protein n=1 Tax=bacterium (Candidatus Blackallbacteria) CG17_big_fil_post_rev_8_21_14_2_50_48_46 TaxID=2014261 RepID=A0A2M7FXM1_9BACT|nr:MAG: hypothetical protein COW64_19640 [bacterium (Candidatus Blackallbacteria) CG18_big_fil_WC_8_21_14_2_50_49_26]PIW13869.1 MAG: hypothetical protein COW36_24700 [bacterium (Candidatus Blackallbacteria) CG17_big_fil_post_rev_8_21_14_2_50_48_46]PIW45095.1 MAG: hypothetical protein COW20_22330 [bacterium (Candidatus Blackallbacteria) CG13_big_fil_rev_8_21_14_2_50_49_14]
MLQFDIVLQKQNLKHPHQETHQAMYMPSHGEFLVEKLAQHGLKPGLISGLDDFCLCPELFNRSDADILIVCGADQHFQAEFLQAWKKIKKTYAYRSLITSEPIYSPAAFYVDEYKNAARQHEQFIETFVPHSVFYNSLLDFQPSEQKYRQSFERYLYSLADPELFRGVALPWSEKKQGLLYLGKAEAWVYSRLNAEAWQRSQQIDYFLAQQKLHFEGHQTSFTFRQCYHAANIFRFQLQPRSGYFFHTARTVQSAIVGTIPVVLLHRDYLSLFQQEAPWARPDQNLILGFDGEYELLLEKLADAEFTEQVRKNLPELLAAGTVSGAIRKLVESIQHAFFAKENLSGV